MVHILGTPQEVTRGQQCPHGHPPRAGCGIAQKGQSPFLVTSLGLLQSCESDTQGNLLRNSDSESPQAPVFQQRTRDQRHPSCSSRLPPALPEGLRLRDRHDTGNFCPEQAPALEGVVFSRKAAPLGTAASGVPPSTQSEQKTWEKIAQTLFA